MASGSNMRQVIDEDKEEDDDWEEIKRKEFERRRLQGWKRIIIKPGVDTNKELKAGVDFDYAEDMDESSGDSYKSAKSHVSSSSGSYRSAKGSASSVSMQTESTNLSPDSDQSLALSSGSYDTSSRPEQSDSYFPAIYDGIPVRLRHSGK